MTSTSSTPAGRRWASWAGNSPMSGPTTSPLTPSAGLLRRQPDLDPMAIEDIYWGAANQAGEDNRNVARMAGLLAGLPIEVPGATVNRLCGSGMQAVISAAHALRDGWGDVVMVGGSESMSRAPYVIMQAGAAPSRSGSPRPSTPCSAGVSSTPRWRASTRRSRSGMTAEVVAAKYDITGRTRTRSPCAAISWRSPRCEAGRFEDEIEPDRCADRSSTTRDRDHRRR